MSISVLAVALHPALGKVGEFLTKSEEWFRSSEGLQITTNVLSWQTAHGSWPKNVDTAREACTVSREKVQGTFDNSATTGELRFLARAFRATKSQACQQAFLKGFDHILKAQHPTGGWPQYYPLSKEYHRHITFNDDAMVRLLQFLRDVAKSPDYEFVDAVRRQSAQASFDRGIQCILKCQIVINGKPTVWCAQHDEINYKPQPARSYELPSLSGAESAGILELLMSLENPSPEIAKAVKSGVEWFASAKVTGVRIVTVDGERKAIADAAAPPLWARFCDLENGRPFFSDRDGVKKYDFNEIGRERRNGYAWYGDWGLRVDRAYAAWKRRNEK